MKIAVLHGQKHHGSTWNTTRLLLDSLASEGDECNEFYVNFIPDCIGCFTCILDDEEKCPHRGLTKPIIKAIEQADILIVDTPNYCMGMTGQLKTFFDHRLSMDIARWTRCRKMAVAVSTTAGASITTKQPRSSCSGWGSQTYRSIRLWRFKWDDVKPETKLRIRRKAIRITKTRRSMGSPPWAAPEVPIQNDGQHTEVRTRHARDRLLERTGLDLTTMQTFILMMQQDFAV